MFGLVCLYDFGDHGNSHPELFYKKSLLESLSLKNWLREEKMKGSSTGAFSWVLRDLSEY